MVAYAVLERPVWRLLPNNAFEASPLTALIHARQAAVASLPRGVESSPRSARSVKWKAPCGRERDNPHDHISGEFIDYHLHKRFKKESCASQCWYRQYPLQGHRTLDLIRYCSF